MSLGTSKALKLFAIVLFSFGMIAPALISSGDVQSETRDTITASREVHLANPAFSLLYEESGGEEERESRDKNSAVFSDFDFSETYSSLDTTGYRQIVLTEQLRKLTSSTRLFTLFRQYLI